MKKALAFEAWNDIEERVDVPGLKALIGDVWRTCMTLNDLDSFLSLYREHQQEIDPDSSRTRGLGRRINNVRLASFSVSKELELLKLLLAEEQQKEES